MAADQFKTMKFLLSTALVALLCASASAQLTTGIVTYDEAIHVDAQIDEQIEDSEHAPELPPELAAQIKAAMADMGKFKKELLLTPLATVYRAALKEEKPPSPGQDNIMIMVSGNEDNDIVHRDMKTEIVTQQREILDKKFLIAGPAETYAWKITGQSKTILDRQVHQATCSVDSTEIVAWFCPQIAVFSGPADFGGLPGLILEVAIGDEMTITASSISETIPDAKDMEVPKKGKKVTPEEFEKIAEEKRSLMEEGESGFQMTIRVED